MKFHKPYKYFRMRCPYCLRVLAIGQKRQYTNLYEHVCDPNDEFPRPFRYTYVCDCDYGKCGWWGDDGELYVSDYETFYRKYKMVGKNTSALFSSDWFTGYEIKIGKIKYNAKKFFNKFFGR